MKIIISDNNHILVDLSNNRLFYYEGNQPVNDYPVGIGKPSTPTPTGKYSVVEKVIDSPLETGTYFLRLSNTKICIRGTKDTSSIGGCVSGG